MDILWPTQTLQLEGIESVINKIVENENEFRWLNKINKNIDQCPSFYDFLLVDHNAGVN